MSKIDIDRKKVCMASRCKWRGSCEIFWGRECKMLGGKKIPRLIRRVPMEDPIPESTRPGRVVASAEPPKKKRKLFGILDIDKIVARKTADQAFCGR